MKTTFTAAVAAIIVSATFAFAAGPTTTTPTATTPTTSTIEELMAQLAALQAQLNPQAGTTPAPGVDQPETMSPLEVARAFVLKPITHYQAFWQGDMLINNAWKYTSMSFYMAKDFSIIGLTVNGVAIPITTESPLWGIPMGNGGFARNVYLSVEGLTDSNDFAGGGYLTKDMVKAGDSLVVVLSPAEVNTTVPFDVATYGNDVGIDIEDFGYGFGYGVQGNTLRVSLPPVGGTYHYVLRQRSTGIVIGDGTIKAFYDTVADNDVYTGAKYLGNVLEAVLPQPAGWESWTTVPSMNLNCSIPTTAGTTVAGQVVFVDVGASGGLELILSGQFWVYVQKATVTGDMTLVPLIDHSSTNQGWDETRVNTNPANGAPGKVVISIFEKPGNTVANPWLNVHRFYGSSPQ
jgi:hypothetical protein